jgi:hypothetical protein
MLLNPPKIQLHSRQEKLMTGVQDCHKMGGQRKLIFFFLFLVQSLELQLIYWFLVVLCEALCSLRRFEVIVSSPFTLFQISPSDFEFLPALYRPLRAMFAEHVGSMELKTSKYLKRKEAAAVADAQ